MKRKSKKLSQNDQQVSPAPINVAKLGPDAIAGIVVAVVVIVIIIILLALWATDTIDLAGDSGSSSITPPPTDLFSCSRPLPGNQNALFVRKALSVNASLNVPNTQFFLDALSTTGFTVNFWYRMRFFCSSIANCPTITSVVPLFRRHDFIGELWDCSLLIDPPSMATPTLNHIRIRWVQKTEPATNFIADLGANELFNVRDWHMISYAITWSANRTVTGFNVWIDKVPYPVTRNGPAHTIALSATTNVGLNLGSTGNVTINIPEQDVSTLSIYRAPIDQAGVDALFDQGRDVLTFAVASTNNLGAWILGKGDVDGLYSYSARTSMCVRADYRNQIILTTSDTA